MPALTDVGGLPTLVPERLLASPGFPPRSPRIPCWGRECLPHRCGRRLSPGRTTLILASNSRTTPSRASGCEVLPSPDTSAEGHLEGHSKLQLAVGRKCHLSHARRLAFGQGAFVCRSCRLVSPLAEAVAGQPQPRRTDHTAATARSLLQPLQPERFSPPASPPLTGQLSRAWLPAPRRLCSHMPYVSPCSWR